MTPSSTDSVKHTAGPWVSESARVYQDGKGGALIATCAWFPGQEIANARLIAAAPDLLAALKGLDEAYCRAYDQLTKAERHEDRMRLIAARAAIAKATGEQS